MEAVNLFARTTNKYRDGYSYLDNFNYFATVKLTPAKMVREPRDYDDGGTFVQYLRVPAGMDTKQLDRALYDTMGGSNCRHEYDCCGCASRRIFTKMISPRKMMVRTSVSYNY